MVLTIVIPTYNCEGLLSACLESVLRQTFGDFEVLIMDGGSMDKTLEIAQSFGDCRLTIVSESDSGVYDAMNKGIRMAKGEWVYFLGSDDSLYNTKVLDDIFTNLDNLGFDVVYGDVIKTDSNLKYAGEFKGDTLLFKNICHQAIFYKRKVFDRVGLYETRLRTLADWHHNFKWFYHLHLRNKYVPVVVAQYGSTGLSSTFREEYFLERITLYFLRYNRELSLGARYYYFGRHLMRAILEKKGRLLVESILAVPNLLSRRRR